MIEVKTIDALFWVVGRDSRFSSAVFLILSKKLSVGSPPPHAARAIEMSMVVAYFRIFDIRQHLNQLPSSRFSWPQIAQDKLTRY